MGYLLTEIVIYLLIAGLIGFAFGWLVRDGRFDKYFEIFKKSSKRKEDSVSDTNDEKKVAEVLTEEVEKSVEKVAVESIDESNKPALLSQIPEAGADKLSSIKGIGPVIEKKLNTLGIYSFEQIASWNAEQELWITKQLAFPKSISKEEWVKQAKELMEAK